jgi:hypothetical protein
LYDTVTLSAKNLGQNLQDLSVLTRSIGWWKYYMVRFSMKCESHFGLGLRHSHDDQSLRLRQAFWRSELEEGQSLLVELFVEEALPVNFVNSFLQLLDMFT